VAQVLSIPEEPEEEPEQKEDASARGESPEFKVFWSPSDSDPIRRGPEGTLLRNGQITPEQLEQATLRQGERPHLSTLDILVESKIITEIQALQALATYFKHPFVRLTAEDVDLNVFGLLPVSYLKSKRVLPFRSTPGGIQLALSDPADIFLIDDVKRRLRGQVQLVVAPPGDILKVVEELCSDPADQLEEIIKGIDVDSVEVVDEKSEELQDLETAAGKGPVIRCVNFLISSAVREGASDIHVEPGDGRVRVRYRIDGILFDQQTAKKPALSMKLHPAIISRLKIMGNLDIAERRLPQDGRIRATVHGRTVDLRVSILPVVHGEKCVIRILDARSTMVGMENLGFLPETLATLRRQILQPHGIVLVTGPTGSGKSTTLYSSLGIMDSDRLNISTVEDPVEYELDFCNQVNVREGIGMTFAAALRSLLRQDPDVIMLGEIRDEETARIAIQAALTGHLVLSTLHTNDAPSSVTRLIDIGIEPFLISAAVNAILAQRLVRRICPDCREPLELVPDNVAKYLQKCGAAPGRIFHGAGCDKCRQTGYKGRIGIYELLVIDEEMRDLISRNPALSEIRRATRETGMHSLQDDGLVKVANGVTTAEELMRVTET